jgi:aminoglycoside 3-N-acetyltransferase
VAAILAKDSFKRWVKLALPLLPARMRRTVNELAATRRRSAARARKARAQFSVAEVAGALEHLPFSADLMVHSSISNIGRLADGTAPDLAREILSRINLTRHTLLVPALPFNSLMKDYLDECAGFDVRSAKNAMGAIANLLMQQAASLRSVHPTHSTVALGAKAAYYVEGHEHDATPFGPHSPFHKLTVNRGQILMFGVGLNSVTCFHVCEDLLGAQLPFAVYQERRYDIACTGRDGSALRVQTPCHCPFLTARRECERARPHLERAGHIRSVALGESEISLLDARGLTVTLLEMLLAGESIYGPVSLAPAQAAAVRDCLALLA